jgi:hypothetical protein
VPRYIVVIALAAAAAALTGCGRPERAAAESVVVDSARPRAVELAEFRAGLPEVRGLEGGATSREALVRSLVRALERSDTAALASLLLSRAEYAWLYYPTTPQSLPPYDLSPALLWFTLSRRSDQDLAVALQTFGDSAIGYRGHSCAATPRREGENLIWGYCIVRVRAGAVRLFGLIIERGGRFKFVSYANKL